MTIVKVLVDAVGEYIAGDIVTDAPDGLVDIAKREVKNSATGELLAVIVDTEELVNDNPSDRELELQIALEDSKVRETELLEQIATLKAEGDLKEIKATAKELKIPGYTKMSVEELKEAIAVIGSGQGAE